MLQLSDTRAYVRVLDESLLPSGVVDISQINGALAWTWGILDFERSGPLDVLSDLELKAGSTNPFIIDGGEHHQRLSGSLSSSESSSAASSSVKTRDRVKNR